MMFNYLTGRVEAFDVEMDNSSSELIDYFLKRRGACAGPNARVWFAAVELLVRRWSNPGAGHFTNPERQIRNPSAQETGDNSYGNRKTKRRRQGQLRHQRHPMVDVMLVLLIIFMVVTPMLQKGVSVDMAKVNNPEQMPDADKEDALLVAVMRDGKVYFGNDQIHDGSA